MIRHFNVQNGTYKQLGKDVGILAAVNSDSNINVAVYLSESDKYKTEFNSWSKKTAQSTLEMCRVVFEAKKELGSQDFLKFCNEIGRKGEDATVRKYLKIGSKYEQFYRYAELLPNAWTSIYEITQLPSDVFEALVATNSSMANMTGDQLKQLMGKKTEDKSKSTAENAAAPTSAAPQTAQNTQEAHEDINAASNTTEQSATATATSDAIQNDSNESVAASVDAESDGTSSPSDRAYAKQATSTMLERVAATACTTVDVESTTAMPTYEVVIRFNSIPTDDSWWDLTEEIENLVEKYNFDVEVVETRPSFV